MIFQDMDRIVFAGDSVTDMGSQNPVGEGLFDSIGHSYVRVIENLLAALYPEVHLRVTNSGISGDNSQMLLARWTRSGSASASASTTSGVSSTARPSRSRPFLRRTTARTSAK